MNNRSTIFKTALIPWNSKVVPYNDAVYARNQYYFGYYLPDQQFAEKACYKTDAKSFSLKAISKDLEINIMVIGIEATTKKFFRVFDLDSLSCRKSVHILDTHHSRYPLSSLVKYFSQERYDSIFIHSQPQHLHFFYELGYSKCYLNLISVDKFTDTYIKTSKNHKIVYVGNMYSPLHYRVARMHEYLNGKNINNQLDIKFFPRCDYKEWINIVSQAEISICCTMNGQFTPQIYNIMYAGSLCLVDRLSKQSVIYNFFNEGEDFVVWDNFEDLWGKLMYFYNHPEEVMVIAKRGQEKANKYFGYRDIRPEYYQAVMFDNIDDKYRASQDLRCCNLKSPSNEHLMRRVRFYETMQEIHRVYERLSVLFFKMKDISSAIDVADLPRLDIDIVPISVSGNTNGKEVLDLLVKNGVDSQINLLMQPNKRYDVICVEVGEINDFRNELSVVKSLMKKTTLLWIFGYLSQPNRKIIRKAGFREHKLCELNYDFRAFAGKVFNKLFKIVLPPTKIITPVSKIDGVSGWKLSRR